MPMCHRLKNFTLLNDSITLVVKHCNGLHVWVRYLVCTHSKKNVTLNYSAWNITLKKVAVNLHWIYIIFKRNNN